MSRTNSICTQVRAIENRHWQQAFNLDTLLMHCVIITAEHLAEGYQKTTKDQFPVKGGLKHWKVEQKCFTDNLSSFLTLQITKVKCVRFH